METLQEKQGTRYAARPPMFVSGGSSVLTGLKLERTKIGRYVILAVRDPLGFAGDAADEIASELSDVTEVTRNGMFTILTGTYKGTLITVCSTGSGAPETELAMVDLLQYGGADTFLRVGTSGTQQPHVAVGDLIITSGAVRDEGASKEYVGEQFPAVASYELLISLVEAAQRAGARFHVGITRSNDSIYCGQGRPVKCYLQPPQTHVVEYWVRAGVLNVDRETSLILTLAQLFGCRGGSICTACNSSVSSTLSVGEGVTNAIHVALEGFSILANHDAAKKNACQQWWSPFLEQPQEKVK